MTSESHGPHLHPCPRCGRDLYRIPRRLVDRLHLFKPVHRYQCMVPVCGWVGNLPVALDRRLARPSQLSSGHR